MMKLQMKGDYEEERGTWMRRQRECQTTTSEEGEDEEGSGNNKKQKTSSPNDGASIEVSRRPRGRPPGSKNKPKPPLVITRDTTDSTMVPHVLEIPHGVDVVDSVTTFARRLNAGLCILAAVGAVSGVTLRHPPSSTVAFRGPFHILSISATFFPPATFSPSSSTGFTISLAGSQGQILGGSVVGSLLAAGKVLLLASAFHNPTFHRIPATTPTPPADEEEEVSGCRVDQMNDCHGQQDRIDHEVVNNSNNNNSNSSNNNHHHHSHHSPVMECSGSSREHMSLFSCHLPSDVIWAPIARPPPPPPY